MTERYYIDTQGPDNEAIQLAFGWLISQLQKSKEPSTGLVCVPTMRNLEGIISNVIGDQIVKALASGKPVGVPNSTSNIRLITPRKQEFSWQGGPILAAYPDKQILDMLDAMPGVTAILAVPWLMKHVQTWIDTWAPQELRTMKSTSSAVTIKNPVVIEALKCLTDTVNLSTGVHHPSDRKATIDLFNRLKGAGELYNPDEVRSWLIREGKWSPQHADDVKLIASSVLAGRVLRGGGRFWADDIIEQWRASAPL